MKQCLLDTQPKDDKVGMLIHAGTLTQTRYNIICIMTDLMICKHRKQYSRYSCMTMNALFETSDIKQHQPKLKLDALM